MVLMTLLQTKNVISTDIHYWTDGAMVRRPDDHELMLILGGAGGILFGADISFLFKRRFKVFGAFE